MRYQHYPELLQKLKFRQIIVLFILIILVIIGAIPNYLSGNWTQNHPIKVQNIANIKKLRQTGLNIPGWQIIKQYKETIGGHKWLIQQLKAQKRSITLMLLPQNTDEAQPQVEWIDINGLQRWQTDSERQLQFTSTVVGKSPAQVTARLFRAWNQQQTFAVVQWYAWAEGGNHTPVRWFLADQIAQWHQHRVAWVAVSLQIAMEPLEDLEKVLPQAESLGKTIQAALITKF